jgi:hypothetical protein
LGFHPVAVVGRLVQKYKIDSYIQKEKQYTKDIKTVQKHRIHEIENKNTKQNTNIKIILKNISRVISK